MFYFGDTPSRDISKLSAKCDCEAALVVKQMINVLFGTLAVTASR